jgi:SAM-dependent methyltransferase
VSETGGGSAPAVRAAYDAVARAYADHISDELNYKPLDRALLAMVAEEAGGSRLADVGCGPGHVTRFLADRHADVVGVDLSAEMINVARERHSDLTFVEASMLDLPVTDGAWAGAVSLYSIIHLTPAERSQAFAELARVIRPGGLVLVAFHVDSADIAAGGVNHLTEWFGEPVALDGYFLPPDDVAADLERAGFGINAHILRRPDTAYEYPSRRCYLLAERSALVVGEEEDLR